MPPTDLNETNFGLVCITHSEDVRFRTVTRKRLLTLKKEEQQAILRELYSANLSRLNKAIDFCHNSNIRLYRMTSSLFPFADDPMGRDLLTELSDEIRRAGERAIELGIRLVLHPDQFVVLSSDSLDVIGNSIKILKLHARVMDLLNQPRSTWSVMQLHGGKGGRYNTLVKVIRSLPDEIRLRLALENDEHAYGAMEILEVCQAAGVPMVFDAHHHVCHDSLNSYEDPSIAEVLALARETWSTKDWQMVHISNGRDFFNDPKHSDLITTMPSAYRNVSWIEVEAKHKELAIERLREKWKRKAHKKAVKTGV
jgi:UV DNA damage endonuclease